MKKHYLYAGLLTLSLAMACTENIIIGDEPTSEEVKTTGVAIKFEANGNEQNINDEASKKFLADIQGVETRTQYAGEGSIAEVQGTNTQLLWSTDDPISIYQAGFSESGNTTTHTEYKIKEGGNKSAKIVATGSEMEWQAGKTGFRFVATYPSVNASGNGITAVNFDNTSNNPQDYTNNVSVTIKPQSSQTCVLSENTLTDNNTVWHLARPDMKNSLMIGADTKLSSGFVPENEDVKLAFDPIMSTLMIAVGGPYNTTTYLKGVKIYLKDNNGNAVNFAESYTLQYQLTDGKAICNKIKSQSGEVPYYYINLNKPIKLGAIENKNHNCLVTAFLPPHVISKGKQQLQIVPEFVESDAEGAALNDWYISSTIGRKDDSYFTPSTKMVVNTGRLMKKFDNAKWMSYIPDNVYIKDLSLPGAHVALNHTYSSTTYYYDEAVRQANQATTIREMLNAGIRVLDLRIGYDDGITTGVRYGRSQATVNNSFSNQKENSALFQVKQFLEKNKTETVILLISIDADYNQSDPFVSYTIAKDQIIEPLMNNKTAWKAEDLSSTGLVYFRDDLTLNSCRGKVVIMFRKTNTTWDGTRNYFAGDKNFEGTTGNLRYGGIGFMPDWVSTNYYRSATSSGIYYRTVGGNDIADDRFDMFKDKDIYYSWKLLANGKKDIGAMAFKKTKVTPLSNGNPTENDATLYYLDKEITSKRSGNYYNDYGAYTHYWNTTIEESTKKNYTGDQSNTLKVLVVKDFLEMAASTEYQHDWFITIVPAWSGYDAFDEPDGAGNINKNWTNKIKKTNTWASNYIETHKPIKEYLEANLGKGRKGMVLFDIVPGKDNDGNEHYSYSSMGYNDVNANAGRYDGNNNVTTEKKNIGKEMTRLLIQDNLMRTLRRKPAQ